MCQIWGKKVALKHKGRNLPEQDAPLIEYRGLVRRF